MISEYALDPELVVRWSDPKEWALFREAFADCTGRLGSTFPQQNPQKWRQKVKKVFFERFPQETHESRAWLRMDALLTWFADRRMVERDTTDAGAGSWLDKAVLEHRRRPFQGILSVAPAPAMTEVLTPEMLFDDSLPAAWSAPCCPPVPRTASDFAEALRPLLLRCREVVFVDPWFDPAKRRFTEPLRALLDLLWGPGRAVDAPEAQLVIAEGGDEGKREGRWLMGQCEERLPRVLPAGQCLKVTVLRQRASGEKIHNRYVLTKFAGVSFGTGLDVADDPESAQTDDLCRLSREQLVSRWGQYVSGTPPFDVAAGPLSIMGSAR